MSIHEAGELSYVVLDVPEPQASAVLSIRERHADLFRAALPVEITLTDSLDPSQALVAAAAAMDTAASEMPAIRTSFASAYRFPDSDTFVVRVQDEEPFRILRDRLLSAGLRVEPSRHDFVPHCTLRTRSPVDDHDAHDLLRAVVPGPLTLDTMSLYTLRRSAAPAGVESELRHRVRLGLP